MAGNEISEHVYFQAGRYDKGLALRAKRHIESVVNQPKQLAIQTPEWVAQQKGDYPDIVKRWGEAVSDQIKLVGSDILVVLQQHIKDKSRVSGIDLPIIPEIEAVLIAQCPICRKKNVPLIRVHPDTFSLKTKEQFLQLVRRCRHQIPIPDGSWQIILNYQEILRNR